MKSNKQQGSHHVIIIIGVTIILAGAIGFMFWKNILNKDTQDAAVSSKTGHSARNAQSTKTTTTTTTQPIASTIPVATKRFSGWTGFQWGTFDYPSDWTVDSDVDVMGTAPNVGPGVIVKAPDFKMQGNGTSGSYIDISVTKNWNASLSYWESQQQPADPNGTWGHFTFAGKPAVIFRSESQYNGAKPPVPTLADMYKGENTWVQGNGVIYTFVAYTNNSTPDKSIYSAIKTVFDSWKWQ